MYRLQTFWASVTRVVVLGGVAATAVFGCQSVPESKPEVSLEGKSDSEILYQAAVQTFRERGLGVDVASEKFMVVTSKYESVSERLRRRFTARIVRLDGGATALRVRAEHERKHGSGEEAVWKKVESEPLRERAAERELDLGRSIEKRFHRWRAERDEESGSDAG